MGITSGLNTDEKMICIIVYIQDLTDGLGFMPTITEEFYLE